MEEKNSPYFGSEGLTMVSANYVANRAKEKYEALEGKLNATSFVGETISIVGALEKTVSKNGTPNILSEAEGLLKKITEMKSLIAFLREAIKEKNTMLTSVKTYISEKMRNHQDNRPVMAKALSENDIIASMSVGDREKYLSLETKCAVIGKYIHPNGPLSRAKSKLITALQDPINAELKGRDTLIREYFPVSSLEDVEALFFKLQKQHREAQAELNGMKHTVDMKLREDESAKAIAYDEAYKAYFAEEKRLMESDRKCKEVELSRIEALKIVIPNRLREIYEEVMSDGIIKA